MRTTLASVIAVLAIHGCTGQDSADTEQHFIEHELVGLRAALAKRSETGLAVSCVVTTGSVPKVTKPVADEIERICYVEAPKIYLQNAVADARKQQAEGPKELAELACMQLFAEDAFKAVAAHPPTDPVLKALVDEYTQLCPAQVAKFRGRGSP